MFIPIGFTIIIPKTPSLALIVQHTTYFFVKKIVNSYLPMRARP